MSVKISLNHGIFISALKTNIFISESAPRSKKARADLEITNEDEEDWRISDPYHSETKHQFCRPAKKMKMCREDLGWTIILLTVDFVFYIDGSRTGSWQFFNIQESPTISPTANFRNLTQGRTFWCHSNHWTRHWPALYCMLCKLKKLYIAIFFIRSVWKQMQNRGSS